MTETAELRAALLEVLEVCSREEAADMIANMIFILTRDNADDLLAAIKVELAGRGR